MRASVRPVVLCLFSSALIAYLAACGSSSFNSMPTSNPPNTSTSSALSKVTMNYAAADTYNNRVLIYNTPFSTDESAGVVLGQADFTHNAFLPIAANTFNNPSSVAVDSSGNLYVADINNCRVLQFKPPFTNNMNASMVIGQASPTTSTCTVGAGTFARVSTLVFDGDGDLWVGDFGNSRIMEFVPPFSTGMNATIVLGQADFTHGAINQGLSAPTAKTLDQPWGMAFDSSGDLWVVDSYNHRMLEYKPPFSNDMAASLELGQPAATAFTSNTANNGGISATSMYFPAQPAFDGDGDLWVSEFGNNRILEYIPPFSNGMAATLELGQPSGATAFTTNAPNTNQSGFIQLYAISFDSNGQLLADDSGNSRVMIFNPPFSNGMNATAVLGQADFTHVAANQGGSVGVGTLAEPWGGVTF
ncbi:MAG: NHL repeat-containing protein [Terracidiphilus sp.]